MTPVQAVLSARIRDAGRITFAEFMETALYHPEGGYYTVPGRISARGDFYTSPVVHPAFGALICVQLREMWELLGSPSAFTCVEFGAAAGVLAADIQSYASRLDPSFAASLTYLTVDRARRPESGELAAAGPATGCVLSNELLDAFPVHRFVIRSGQVRELYVHMSDGKFGYVEGEPSTPEIERRVAGLTRVLPDGFRGEVSAGIDEWAVRVSAALERGFVLTIDFGLDRPDLYSPERSPGTLRCYFRHTATSDPFRRVGDQDMAAHVDFTAVDESLSQAGLSKVGHTTQSEFLRRLGADEFLARLPQSVGSGGELARNRAAILELLKPEGLGGFRVAVHGKGVGRPRLTGIAGIAGPTAPRGAQGERLPVPLLIPGEERVPVLEGRYPHAAQELSGTWDELFRK